MRLQYRSRTDLDSGPDVAERADDNLVMKAGARFDD